MQEIRAWLENRDYQVGVALYEKHGTSDFLKKLFKSGSSDYNRGKLLEELSAIAEDGADPLPSPKPDLERTITSPQYLKLTHERQQIYRQIDRNMMLLDTSRSDVVRHQAAKQVLKLHRRKMAVFAELDYMEEHGTPMPVTPTKEYRTPEMQRLYVQISKAEKRLEKEVLRNREKTVHLLAKKRARLEELRRERSGS